MAFYQRKRRMPTVIIVSLIDIFVILLIFVVVTTTFRLPQQAIPIRLPDSTTAAPVPPGARQPVELAIASTGEVFIDGVPVALEALSARVAPFHQAGRPLAIKADKEAPFGIVVRVFDALKEAGIAGNFSAYTQPLPSRVQP